MGLRLCIVGFGNVGTGFARILLRKDMRVMDMETRVTAIVDPVKGSVIDPEGIDLGRALTLVSETGRLEGYGEGYVGEVDTLEVVKDSIHDLVIELTPTNIETGEPGYSHVKTALETGKHVITTNKGPIALHLHDLLSIARERGLYLGFEGTVMSGTPLIKTLLYGMDRGLITRVEGVLNGTTNYILTRMEEGLTYEEALREAREKGYAEADPSMDIDGHDLAAKASIIASLIEERQVTPRMIRRTSLRRHLETEGYREGMKYVLSVEKGSYRVETREYPENHPLRMLRGVENGAIIETEYLGKIFLRGPGAGREETGYAVLTDLIDLIRRLRG